MEKKDNIFKFGDKVRLENPFFDNAICYVSGYLTLSAAGNPLRYKVKVICGDVVNEVEARPYEMKLDERDSF